MKRKIRGFTLIELLVVIAIIALLISILLPSLSRARELSKRLVCGSNTKGIGTSGKIYANDNSEQWPVPPFDPAEVIQYVPQGGGGNRDPGGVGFNRQFRSDTNSSVMSVTRSFWIMVRSGDVTVKQFICPSSTDTEDPTDDLDLYYDFTEYNNISYGYLVPFGPRDTRPREGMDNRAPMLADKGPFYTPSNPEWTDPAGLKLTVDSAPKDWARYNSPNHGGRGNGEGQNVLFADGHSAFEKVPIVGIDQDNLYTLMTNEWAGSSKENIIHGEAPGEAAVQNPYPGQGVFAGSYSSTDSLIFP